MTFGQRHPDLSRFWLHTEPQTYAKAKGHRFWLRVGRVSVHFEWERISRHEWGVYFDLYGRAHEWLRFQVGPGVIPF